MQIVLKKFKKNSWNNKLILKTQKRFRSEKHNVFTEEIDKIALSSNDDKRIQPIHSLEAYANRINKDLVYRKEKTKCNNLLKQYKNV